MKPFSNYRPHRSCGQGYVFTRVCDSVNRGVSGRENPPCQGDTPQSRPPQHGDTPDHTPPQSRHPWSRHPHPPPTPWSRHPHPWPTPPPEQTHLPQSRHPPEQTPPPGSRHSPRQADSSIGSTSGQYASYTNAFLFLLVISGPVKCSKLLDILKS